MASWEKIVERMRNNPVGIRWRDVQKVLRRYELEQVHRSGSHVSFRTEDRRYRITLTEPHGGERYVHPQGIKALLRLIDKMDADA